MYITIDEEDYERMKNELTPLGMSGVFEDEDGNIVNVEPSDTQEAKKQTYKPVSRPSQPDRSNPGYWVQFYDPRYCGGSLDDYCKKMAAKYGYCGK